MVRIRFRRVGSRNQVSWRIVAADRESPRDGRFLEILGSYNPRTKPSTVLVDEARLFHWMSNGAQPSDSLLRTLKPIGTWERWERFKQGESLEMLVQEAKAGLATIDPRTRRDDLVGQRSSKKQRPKKDAGRPKPAPTSEPVTENAGPVVAEKSEASAEAPAE